MPSLGFKKQFVGPIKRSDNPKDQTIRAFRSRPIGPTDRLYLFTGMRTANCKKIGEATCVSVQVIELNVHGYRLAGEKMASGFQVLYEMTELDKLNEFAIRDGFKSWSDLVEFWRAEHGDDCFPFRGELIRFRLLPKKHWKKLVPQSKLA
jgi:hypothetical protein